MSALRAELARPPTAVSPCPDATLAELKALLDPLEDGPRVYQSMVHVRGDGWGTVPGKEYSLGVTDDDGNNYRSVMAWIVRKDGSVLRKRREKLGNL